MNKLIMIAMALTLTGCGTFGRFIEPRPIPEPEIVTVIKKEPIRIYQPQPTPPIEMLDVNWFVITEENLDEQVEHIENMLGGQFVVFALTPDGYEKMAENLQEIRRYIRQQKELLVYYREATTGGETAEEWLEINNEENNINTGENGSSEEGDGQADTPSDSQGQN